MSREKPVDDGRGRSPEQILREADQTLAFAREGLQKLLTEWVKPNIADLGLRPEDAGVVNQMIAAENQQTIAEYRNGQRLIAVFGCATTIIVQNLAHQVDGFDEWWAPRSQDMAADPLMEFFYKSRSEILKHGTLRANGFDVRFLVSPDFKEVARIVATAKFDGAGPQTHMGLDASTWSPFQCGTAYLDWLDRIVGEAWTRFSDPALRGEPEELPGEPDLQPRAETVVMQRFVTNIVTGETRPYDEPIIEKRLPEESPDGAGTDKD
jgi:hypothetical protein